MNAAFRSSMSIVAGLFSEPDSGLSSSFVLLAVACVELLAGKAGLGICVFCSGVSGLILLHPFAFFERHGRAATNSFAWCLSILSSNVGDLA